MPTLLLGVFNQSNGNIDMNQLTHLVGTEVMPVQPDPVNAGGTSAGLFDSDGGQDLELTYNATIAPNVTLFIDIWIRRSRFEKLIVTSTDPANYPIQGQYQREADGSFYCGITVG